uniref:Uncharacterized protein n=1 Tax=Kwoniella dejecticola CBS 10117 TaxID=1296121 RepID=A0A1A6A4B3_9TREE|nr:uncharacterized protein I303_04205 [Kwoniella dejecticola CBS 10117]OBR84883.1 hypothetical protein I303_04205 [Kwoniella dejecticola CBS 10117]
MSSSNALANARLQAQWEAEERKLQSVYDDVSSHRLSFAQSTLTRYLKKNPKSQPALILKLYINQKTGAFADQEELLRLYAQIKGLGEMTGRGVWWVGLVFRNMGRTDLALQLYNELSNKHPDNPALLEQVFLHAAAANDVEVLVKSSRKMFSLTREDRWARLSAWSEWVKSAPQPTPSQPFPPPAPENSLKLALLLLNTVKSPQHTSETLWLKAQILLSAEQLEEALQFLREEGKQGGIVRLWWRMEFVREILRRLSDKEDKREVVVKEWEVEVEWAVALLKTDKDSQKNYAYYRHLLLSLQNLILLERTDKIRVIDDLLDEIEKEIGLKERSPALARLELQSILRKQRTSSDVILDNDVWLKVVEKYWIQWGSKGSIVSEIEGIVNKDDEERKILVKEFVEKQAAQQHSDEQSFREQVNAQIYLLRNRPSTWKPNLKEIKVYWQLYLSGLQYGENLPKTDIRPADQIGLTTVSLLIELWFIDKSDIDLLMKAIICLETIIKDSPASAHARYFLIRLYRLIGAPSLVGPHLTALKISEIQLDNLLHIFTERGAAESLLGENREIWSDHAKKSGEMYLRTSVDFPEYVKESLSNETYSKIPSIQYIHSSLADSITNRSRTIEQARLATYISAPFGTKLLKKLELAKTSTTTDLRNWELIHEIGRNRPLVRDLTGDESGLVDEKWIKSFAGLYSALGRFVNGEEVEVANETDITLLPCEASLVRGARKLLRSATAALHHPEEMSEDEKDVKSMFDESIQSASSVTSASSSRWAYLQALTCLYELIEISDVILDHLVEVNKTLKGKKKSPVLAQLVTDLRATKEKVSSKGVLKPLLDNIDKINEVQVDWKMMNDGWVDDAEFVNEMSQKIDTARKVVLDRIKMLLEGKSLDAAKNITSNGKKM